jgi:lysyl-tRNA synthetase class II
MSEDIKSRLQEYVKQEQVLLDQILQLRNQKNVGAEIGKAVLSEGAAALAAGLFESSTAGRLGRKLTKSALDQQQKNQLMIQERNIESQHNSLVQRVSDFVSSLSVKRKSLQEANSYELIRKLERAQEFLKVETCIRRTVTILMSIASKQLIYNKDIQASHSVKEIIILPGEPFSGSLKSKEMLRSVR